MANGNVPNKISLYPDQLTSLLSLARVMPAGKHSVLLALLRFLQADSLKSTATRKEIKECTGLGYRTIYTFIKEFETCGLLRQWRGPFSIKQKFYKIILPASDRVLEFYKNNKRSVSPALNEEEPAESPPSEPIDRVDTSPAQDANATPEANAVNIIPLQDVDMTQIPTLDPFAPAAGIETEPALDPRIAQVLDLKATEDGNVIVQFLKRQGLCRTNSFGSIHIDGDGLLRYLLEEDANDLAGFSRLLAEFKAGPQIDQSTDEDLQIDLHNSFFDFPYGAQWFWQCCPTKDDNGFLLREGGFGVNVVTFMTQHGLKCFDDIVKKVAAIHEELRPKPSEYETGPLGYNGDVAGTWSLNSLVGS